MKPFKMTAVAAAAIATAACSQGNSDNVMSPEANALTPAEVNEALGPETANSPDMNVGSNDLAANEAEPVHKAPNINDEPDEPGYAPVNNSGE